MGLILICTKIPSHGAAGEGGVEVDANDRVVCREVFTPPGGTRPQGGGRPLSPGPVLAEVPQGAGAPRSHRACRSPWLCLGLGRRVPRDGDFGDAGVWGRAGNLLFCLSGEQRESWIFTTERC